MDALRMYLVDPSRPIIQCQPWQTESSAGSGSAGFASAGFASAGFVSAGFASAGFASAALAHLSRHDRAHRGSPVWS
jgi:hypothetical protein